MRTAIVVLIIWEFSGAMATGQPAEKLGCPSGVAVTRTPVNSQKSLVEIVGNEFGSETWEYPSGLLAREFPGFTYVGGPYDKGLAPKAQWGKPVILKNQAAGMELAINCYRYSPPPPPKPPLAQEKTSVVCVPYLAREPNYPYKPTEFNQLRAGTASISDRDIFVFRDGDLLFKIEATGGKAEDRRKSAAAAAKAIWKFRQTKGKVPAGQAAPPWDAPPPPDGVDRGHGGGGLFGAPPQKPGLGGTGDLPPTGK